MSNETLERIEQKIDRLIEAIGFRLPFSQKGEEDYGRQKESDRSSIKSSSPGQT